MKQFCNRILFHTLSLVVSLVFMGVLGLILSVPNWPMVGVGVWFLVCYSSLCFPDSFWENWTSKWTK